MFSIRWRARGRGCLLAGSTQRRPVLTPPRPAPPPRRAPPRPDRPVVCPGFGFDRLMYVIDYVIVPGHALHEKGFQSQIGVGTLVSSQERRSVAVSLINRLSTAGQPRVNRWSTADFVPCSVYIGFRLFVLPKGRPGQCPRYAAGQEGGLIPGRIDPTASRPTQPRNARRAAVRRADPTGP